MRPVAQARQARAWDAVREAKRELTNDFAGYANLLKSFPGLVRSGGFGPALAFLKVKKGSAPHERLYCQLTGWLTRSADAGCPLSGPYPADQDLIEAVCEGSSAAYRRATAEALAFLADLRLLAGVLESEGSRPGAPPGPGEGGVP